MMGPDPAPHEVHLTLIQVMMWATPVASGLLAAFFGLWNRSQEREMTTLAESIKGLRDLHESQEQRFDEREKIVRHELGAQNAITMSAVHDLQKRHVELLDMWNACRNQHERERVRPDDIADLRNTMRTSFERVFSRLDNLDRSVAAHHAIPHTLAKPHVPTFSEGQP